MRRVLCIMAILLLVVPVAQAAPSLATVAVGPKGLAAEGEPYYVRAELTPPELPAASEPTHDCGAGARPRGIEGLRALAGAILAWHPLEETRLSGWFPTCVAASVESPCDATFPVCPGGGGKPLVYASYDTAEGRYYAEARVPDVPGVSSFPQQAQTVAFSGTTGAGLMTDCEACPTPP